ncbi:hypothetical protein BDZ45DRAFT_676513 [Acephala macrosclerotiorum]|nr:hypothetical protein BDZ45DRAFT_676513 [Acephala macrosclerotiorum]
MASRGFSSSGRAAKALKWKLNGTTVQVDKYIKAVESAIDTLPSQFAAKAKVGIIQGNPHETPDSSEPMHASGRIGEGSANGKKRLSSFHAYPDGSVIFSDPALKPFNKGPDEATASESQAAGAGSSSANDWQLDLKTDRYWRWAADGKTAEWAPAQTADTGSSPSSAQVWDEDSQKYKYWDGYQWIFRQQG